MGYRKFRFWITLLFCIGCFFPSVISYSDGPPEGRTGAPGELTCYNGYCHNSYLVNSGTGQVSFSSGLSESGYLPGETYDITVSVSHLGKKAFGFQLLPYSPERDAALGTLIETDTALTQLKTDEDRTYIMHDSAQVADDSATWSFRWKAPQPSAGPVVFYATFLGADNNGNRSGDYVYKKNWPVNPDPAASLEFPASPVDYFGFHPHDDGWQLSWVMPRPAFLEIICLDLSGKTVFSLKQNLNVASGSLPLPTLSILPPGVYVLNCRADDYIQSKKLLLR
ncbi:MAG: choice-of-anchor V domain-containing protein [Bacteroidia bacterium]|nr:choice-of-anchor V domain-containing protein [Bacteroidia bacterium]